MEHFRCVWKTVWKVSICTATTPLNLRKGWHKINTLQRLVPQWESLIQRPHFIVRVTSFTVETNVCYHLLSSGTVTMDQPMQGSTNQPVEGRRVPGLLRQTTWINGSKSFSLKSPMQLAWQSRGDPTCPNGLQSLKWPTALMELTFWHKTKYVNF